MFSSVCASVYTCMSKHVLVCDCVWRPEDNLGSCSSGATHILFLRQCLSLSCTSPTWLPIWPRDLPASTSLALRFQWCASKVGLGSGADSP